MYPDWYRVPMKALSLLFTVLAILTIIFVNFMVIPGNPAIRMINPGTGSYEYYERIVDEMRLDGPLFDQYVDYVRDSLIGDFRLTVNYRPGTEVEDMIWKAMSPTLLVFVTATTISILLALGLEYIASSSRNRYGQLTIHLLSAVALSTPAMWFALWLVVTNADNDLGFPLLGNGMDAVSEDGIAGIPTVLHHLALPLLSLVLATFGVFVFVFRWADRMARARDPQCGSTGFIKWCVSMARELTGMRPLVYLTAAWAFCAYISIDGVFTYGGLGTLLLAGFNQVDYPLMMAVMFVSSMSVLVAGMTLNVILNLASRRSLTLAMKDWVQRDVALERGPLAPTQRGVATGEWTLSVARRCIRSKAFMIALGVILATTIAALLAPILATVQDPSEWSNLEPNRFSEDWINPLPPSLEPSPYTDFLHPLGTDAIGRDLYSMMLYGARPAIIIASALMAGAILIGLVAGIISYYLPEPDMFPQVLRDLFDFAATIAARTYVTIPLTILVLAMIMVAEHTILSFVPILLFAVYSWAWIIVCRQTRATKRTLGDEHRLGRAVPGILAESLAIAKFTVPFTFLVEMVLSDMTWSPTGEETWFALLSDSYSHGGLFADTSWHLLYIPVVAIVLVCASLFVIQDRAEHMIRASDTYPQTAPHPSYVTQ